MGNSSSSSSQEESKLSECTEEKVSSKLVPSKPVCPDTTSWTANAFFYLKPFYTLSENKITVAMMEKAEEMQKALDDSRVLASSKPTRQLKHETRTPTLVEDLCDPDIFPSLPQDARLYIWLIGVFKKGLYDERDKLNQCDKKSAVSGTGSGTQQSDTDTDGAAAGAGSSSSEDQNDNEEWYFSWFPQHVRLVTGQIGGLSNRTVLSILEQDWTDYGISREDILSHAPQIISKWEKPQSFSTSLWKQISETILSQETLCHWIYQAFLHMEKQEMSEREIIEFVNELQADSFPMLGRILHPLFVEPVPALRSRISALVKTQFRLEAATWLWQTITETELMLTIQTLLLVSAVEGLPSKCRVDFSRVKFPCYIDYESKEDVVRLQSLWARFVGRVPAFDRVRPRFSDFGSIYVATTTLKDRTMSIHRCLVTLEKIEVDWPSPKEAVFFDYKINYFKSLQMDRTVLDQSEEYKYEIERLAPR